MWFKGVFRDEPVTACTDEKQGRTRIYRIQRKRLELVRDWLAHFSTNDKEKHNVGETE
jgi:hypothetical protein